MSNQTPDNPPASSEDLQPEDAQATAPTDEPAAEPETPMSEPTQTDPAPSTTEQETPSATATAEPLPTPSRKHKIEKILSMRMPVIVKLAEKKLTLSSILKLSYGSILNFENDAYEHVDLMINNALIGRGQTVKVSENFGLRITQIGSPEEMLQALGLTQPTEE